MDYQQKYLKYKNKYLTLKAQMGGNINPYTQNFKSVTLNNCNVTGNNDYTGRNFCNCPGFLHKNLSVPDNTQCFLCLHQKKYHKSNDLSFGITDELCNSK